MESNEILQGLKSLVGFSALDDKSLEQVVGVSSTRIIRAGETIFCQTEPSPFCFGVLSGEIVIQHVSKDSHLAPKVLGVVHPGGLFGESAIFEESPRAAMASASQDGKLLVVRGPALREWMKKNAQAAQPLLLALLKTSLNRLQRTSQELSLVHGVGRLFGSGKPFIDQMTTALGFLRGALPGLDDVVFYQRSLYWEEFSPLISLPLVEGLPMIPLNDVLTQRVSEAGGPQSFEPGLIEKELSSFKLPWESCQSVAIIPLFDWDKVADPLQGLLFLASKSDKAAFSGDRPLLLAAVSNPLAEALSRYGRIQDASAQTRLEQSKKSFPR